MSFCQTSSDLRKISEAELFVSEPEPAWFGNGPNDPQNPYWTNSNWLISRFHFSFAEWSAGRTNLGCLRVVNDDLIQPQRGFGTHGHHDMEIVSYILNGNLTHQDSMGTQETLSRGDVQFMTAGTGVQHSEYNRQKGKELRFIQSWILPRSQALKPNCGSYVGKPHEDHELLNNWVHLVSDIGQSGKVHINQDCNFFVCEIDPDYKIPFELSQHRQAYVVFLEGSVKVDGMLLERHEASEIRGGGDSRRVVFTGQKSQERTHILLYEMAL